MKFVNYLINLYICGVILRHIYTEIQENLAYFPVLGIVGPRQVGKTTLAKQIPNWVSKECVYLDLQLTSDLSKLENAEAYFELHTDKCVIIDEIQRMPELFSLIRAMVDKNRVASRFVLLGSASPKLLRDSSETLAGRIAYTELTPFSLPEVEDAYTMENHWFRGGFPGALLAPSDKIARRWQHNFIKTFVERDLADLGADLPSTELTRMIQMLASVSSEVLNISDLSRSLGISQPTIKKYLNILDGAFLINILQPYYVNTTKRISKRPKVYIRDSGLLHSLHHIASYEQLYGHILIGASWEGYVIEQCIRYYGTEWEYYYYRTQNGAEVDLILTSPNGKTFAIEIKSI